MNWVKNNTHHRATRLRECYGAAGAHTESFSFFAYREIPMGKKNSTLRGRQDDNKWIAT
jgi:hypothetical protein